MFDRTETHRLTPEALSEGLAAAGLSLREFCFLFDVAYSTGRDWTYPEGHKRAVAPPYWVTPVLAACADPGALYDFRACRRMNDAGPRISEISHAD